jgi:hypothetical protein
MNKKLEKLIEEIKHFVQDGLVHCHIILKDGKGTIVGQVPATEDVEADKVVAQTQATEAAAQYLNVK